MGKTILLPSLIPKSMYHITNFYNPKINGLPIMKEEKRIK